MNTTMTDAEIEIRCPQCDGKRRSCVEDDGVCGLCDGTGMVLTELGEKIVALIQRRFHVSVVEP